MSNKGRTALIVGVTGIAGLNLAKKMLTDDKYGKWKVYGLSRKPSEYLPGEVTHVACDLLNANAAKVGLAPLTDVTHVFYTAWINKTKEEHNISANGTMMQNLVDYLPANIQHFVLLTGLKHYLGPFFWEGERTPPPTPFKETAERLPIPNFYYTLEDIVFKTAKEKNFTWSVARPACIIGFAPNNAMNMGMTLAVYASICKYSGKPFEFLGSTATYDVVFDVTDADLLADHMLWEATTPAAANQAYNVVNGGVFRWRQMWEAIAKFFDLQPAEYSGNSTSLVAQQAELEKIWKEMVKKFNLKASALTEVATPWFMDVVGNTPLDFFGDMTKSRDHGFLVYQNSEQTFFKLFNYMRDLRIIPPADAPSR